MAHRTTYSLICKLALFLSFSCLSPKVYCQLNLKDSLTIKALSDSIFRHEMIDPDKALSFVKKKMAFCLAIKNTKYYLNTMTEKMNVHALSSRLMDLSKDFEEFDMYFNRLNTEGEKYSELFKIVNSLKLVYYFQIADYDKIKAEISNQLNIIENKKALENKDYWNIYTLKQKSVEVNLRIGNYQAAINDVEFGLNAFYKINKKLSAESEMSSFGQLSGIYLKIKQFDKAEYYFNKKMQNFEILKKNKSSNLDLLYNYLSASKFYFTIDKVDKSLFYLNKLEKLASKNENSK